MPRTPCLDNIRMKLMSESLLSVDCILCVFQRRVATGVYWRVSNKFITVEDMSLRTYSLGG
jgi:hypothetical protein